MRMHHALVVLAVLLFVVSAPAVAKDNRSGAGFGLTGGVTDSDTVADAVGFSGYTLFWKLGFTDTWGLQVQYRDMSDNEVLSFGFEDDYTQIGVHAVYMWRHGKRVRPHIKFGLTRTEFEETSPFFPTASDDDTVVSIGGGLEAGSERIAFFGDYDYSEPDLFDETFMIGNLTVGIVFKY